MQPRSHAFVIEAAVARCGERRLTAMLPELLRGHRDEDDLVVFGLRLRAAGLTHSYRPGQARGELLAPSALWCLRRCLRAAARAPQGKQAWWLGRACHLLADMAVPSRARGVWHLLGDPFELWLETHIAQLPSLLPPSLSLPEGPPETLADTLARTASSFAADTTRTPWGAWRWSLFGSGVRLSEQDAEAQARELVPLVVASTAAVLRWGIGGAYAGSSVGLDRDFL